MKGVRYKCIACGRIFDEIPPEREKGSARCEVCRVDRVATVIGMAPDGELVYAEGDAIEESTRGG